MHQRLKCITIMQCIVGNPMQIVLWRVMLNYVLAQKKKKKRQNKRLFFFLTVCSLGFRAAARGTGLSQLFDIQHHVRWCSSSQDAAEKDGLVRCSGFSIYVSLMSSFKILLARQRKNLTEYWSGTAKRNVSCCFFQIHRTNIYRKHQFLWT